MGSDFASVQQTNYEENFSLNFVRDFLGYYLGLGDSEQLQVRRQKFFEDAMFALQKYRQDSGSEDLDRIYEAVRRTCRFPVDASNFPEQRISGFAGKNNLNDVVFAG